MTLTQRNTSSSSTGAPTSTVKQPPQQKQAEEPTEKASALAILVSFLLVALSPTTCQVLAFITNSRQFDENHCADASSSEGAKCPRTISGMMELYQNKYLALSMGGFNVFYADMINEAFEEVVPALKFLLLFNLLALLLYWYRGSVAQIKYGPTTPKGARPDYIDNGVSHCVLFSLIFIGLSNASEVFGYDEYLPTANFFKLSVIFTYFQGIVLSLNVFGLLFCLFLYFKGQTAPSGPDNGFSGNGVIFDYYWGMELYPRIFGVDVKRFVNCRFSMTFWMLAGVSFTAASVEKTGLGDWDKMNAALFFSALSQFIYLCKFFYWEIGYMRSIDIIVDRAGFYETWGCLVWVPSVYTLHSRILVNSEPQYDWNTACAIFLVGTVGGVLINYWADAQRQWFREANGDIMIWGRQAQSIRCKYKVRDSATGQMVERESLLLASGFWGTARHFQYLFELLAAWSWCLLGTNLSADVSNGYLPLFYSTFLTILLIHRAGRDEEKCLKKYGDGYRKYMELVPYKIIPGIY